LFECKQCGKYFNKARNLKRHGKVHAVEKPGLHGHNERKHKIEPASDCSSSSAFVPSLPDHSPDQIKSYSCWICQEELNNETILLEHYDDHVNYVSDGASEDTT